MLRSNLFAIMMVMSVSIFTGTTYGQWHPEIDKVRIERKQNTSITKVTKPPVNKMGEPMDFSFDLSVMNKNCQEFEAIQSRKTIKSVSQLQLIDSPRDSASGQIMSDPWTEALRLRNTTKKETLSRSKF